jgi:predicted permease
LKDVVVGDVGRTLVVFLVASGLIWVIAVGNVTNLFPARGNVRMREMAIRASLGAGRGRSVRQMIVEAAAYGLVGGALGLALGVAGVDAIRTVAPPDLPRIDEITVNPRVALLALMLGVSAGVVGGMLPIVRGPRDRLSEALRENSASAGEGRRRGVVRRTLLAVEIALTLTVLVAAGLFLQTMNRLEAVDPGFRSDLVLTFRLWLTGAEYRSPDRMAAFLMSLKELLSGVAGVRSVAFTSSVPMQLSSKDNVTFEGAVPDAAGPNSVVPWIDVDSSYFGVVAMPLRAGRTFSIGDRSSAVPVAIVSESFAQKYFPDGQAIGKRLKGGDWNAQAPWTTIVGVVGDVPYEGGVWTGAQPTVYVPYLQTLGTGAPYVVIKSSVCTA